MTFGSKMSLSLQTLPGKDIGSNLIESKGRGYRIRLKSPEEFIAWSGFTTGYYYYVYLI